MLRLTIIIAFSATIVFANIVFAEDSAVRPSQAKLLEYYDSIFDPKAAMLREEFASPGYHSQIPAGTPVHRTRESLYYAIALLQRNALGDTERARHIIRNVLALQDTKPTSSSYGVWPWLLEEPLDQMKSVDLNWADFCGAAIGQMLVEHHQQLDGDLREAMRLSLQRAAQAIRRRDVKPGYTNIAVLGGGVCCIAGEVLADDELLGYGRERLKEVVRHTREHGGFNEYNSPPYGKVVIAECERILQLCDDSEVRQSAGTLRRLAWRMISQSFHVGTQQWAGPHSRSSRNRLRGTLVSFLNERLGPDSALLAHPSMRSEKPRGYAVVQPIACPPKFAGHFSGKTQWPPYQLQRTFILGNATRPATVGTTWHSRKACLGSVSNSSFWTQRKPIIGYWKTKVDPAVVFRVRFLHEGQDFASMGVRTDQSANRILCLFHSLQDRGIWHRSLDRVEDGLIRTSDLRVRFELSGQGVAAQALAKDACYSLSAENHRVIFRPSRVHHFADEPLIWSVGQSDNSAFVDGVCYSGEEKEFDFNQLINVMIAVGLELQHDDSTAAVRRDHWQPISAPTIDRHVESVTASWATPGRQLTVEAPAPHIDRVMR